MIQAILCFLGKHQYRLEKERRLFQYYKEDGGVYAVWRDCLVSCCLCGNVAFVEMQPNTEKSDGAPT